MSEIINITKITPFSDSPTPAFDILPLTYLDFSWFKIIPVERLFFYDFTDLTSDLFDSVILPKLKHSLSLTLLHYLPLAGNILWPSDAAKPAVYYFPNDGVSVTTAVSTNADFNLLSGNGIRKAVEFHHLVPRLSISDDKAEVIAIQITLFPNEGFSIGITSHHAVLDGKSSTTFVKSWAYLCKQLQLCDQEEQKCNPCLPPELTPFFDRTVIKDPEDQDMGRYFNKRSLKVSPFTSSVDCNKLVRATFELTREDIKKIRDKVSEISEVNLHLSTFVVTLAYVLVCFVKAKIGEGNNDVIENVIIGFTVDYRSRLDPPVPLNYFGNCVGKQIQSAKTSDVMQENGLVFAAEMISNCVKRIDADINKGSDEKIIAKLMQLLKQGAVVLSVAGSNRFDIYGSDFGWGRPKKAEIVSIDRTDAISLAESKDGSGGGVEVGVALEKQQMEVFASLFIDGLKK